MRTCFCLALALLGGSAQAQSEVPSVHVTAQRMVELEGSYGLENGQRVDIFVMDERLYIDLPRQRKELLPVAPNVFASRDGTVSVQPLPHADDAILLDYQASGQGAISMRPRWRGLR